MAIANPSDLPAGCAPLDVGGEADSLAGVLADLSGRVQGTLLAGRTGLPDEIRQRLIQQGWTIHDGVTSWQAIQRWLPGHHVLHILAHGQFKAGEVTGQGHGLSAPGARGLPPSVARGALDRVPDDDIVTGLAGVDPLPQLVFLAACDSAKRPQAGSASHGRQPLRRPGAQAGRGWRPRRRRHAG